MEKFSLSIINILSIISVFAAVMFVFQLYFLKAKKAINLYFSIYLISIAKIVLFFLILDLDYQKIAVALIPIFIIAVLSLGPILWLTVNSLVEGKKTKVLKHLYLPIGTSVIIGFLLVLTLSISDQSVATFIQDILTYVTLFALTAVFVGQNGYYIYQSLNIYKGHLKRVEEVFSYKKQVDLRWLKFLVYGYVVFILCLIASNLLDDVWSASTFYFILFAYIIFSGNNALKHQPVFEGFNEKEREMKEDVDIKNPLFEQLKEQLLASMDKDKLFLDDSLTIHSLANTLDTNSKYLSQLINNEFEKSFVVFVNEYRINEAKRLLKDEKNKNLTIEGVGYMSGFKSKSAFNSAFKKFTGDTPSSFLKKGI